VNVAEYVTVAQVGEIVEGGRKVVAVGETYVLIANVGGELLAIEDTCTHDGNELSDGVIEGHVIECSRHGARFDLRTGRGTFPAVVPVATYPVRIAGSDVQIEIDDED
jgi:3-phenylpropionate/trans-cinnamate dioxygenase ferredoxin subunit